MGNGSELAKQGGQDVLGQSGRTPGLDVGVVYEGDNQMNISLEDLVANPNPLVIKGLIGSHNGLKKSLIEARQQLDASREEIGHLKASPFVAIGGAVGSVGGSICVGIALKLLAASQPWGYTLLTLGGVFILTGSLANILWPHARKWFGK